MGRVLVLVVHWVWRVGTSQIGISVVLWSDIISTNLRRCSPAPAHTLFPHFLLLMNVHFRLKINNLNID